MKYLLVTIWILVLLCGCYTNKGRLADGTIYLEYDMQFDNEEGKFSAPLTSDTEEALKEGE